LTTLEEIPGLLSTTDKRTCPPVTPSTSKHQCGTQPSNNYSWPSPT